MLTPVSEDPFAETTLPVEPIEVTEARVLPRRRRFSFAGLAAGALPRAGLAGAGPLAGSADP